MNESVHLFIYFPNVKLLLCRVFCSVYIMSAFLRVYYNSMSVFLVLIVLLPAAYNLILKTCL